MRAPAKACLIGLSSLALGATATAQRPDDQILPRSTELQAQGQSALAAGKFDQAEDLFESALAVDPRNRFAYVQIARVAERQHLFGKAVRMTNKALAMEPNDPPALAVQGEAMVELGAVARAQENLAKLKQVCTKGCPAEIVQLEAAIARGPTLASAKPATEPTKKN